MRRIRPYKTKAMTSAAIVIHAKWQLNQVRELMVNCSLRALTGRCATLSTTLPNRSNDRQNVRWRKLLPYQESALKQGFISGQWQQQIYLKPQFAVQNLPSCSRFSRQRKPLPVLRSGYGAKSRFYRMPLFVAENFLTGKI